MKELKYILQLKNFSSKLSVLWKKTQPQTNSYFRSTSSTPCSFLIFGFASELKDEFLLLSLGKLAFQLFSSYTHRPQTAQPS